jgi:hypothetical protein
VRSFAAGFFAIDEVTGANHSQSRLSDSRARREINIDQRDSGDWSRSVRVLKWFLAAVAVVLVALSIFLINLIWFRPWSLNLFYEKVFAEFLFDEPETLSAIGWWSSSALPVTMAN